MNTPNIVSAEKYDISAENFSKAAITVVRDLQEAGYEAYLVGGCIRDALLGRKPKDFDVSTSASPEQVKKTFRNSRIIGRRFRIVHVRIGRELIEVSTFRANPHEKENASRNESREGDEGQLIRDNVFGTCDEDAWRRDFSINALYYDPIENLILDYMDSISDIKNGVLRSIGEMDVRFIEDPVRMLRIIRFAAKFDFVIPEEAKQIIHDKNNLISTVSAPRLFEEVLKLFHGGQAVKSFNLLREFGLFKLMFPFTSEYLIEGEMSLPEKALTNTDKRIQSGKRVIPAFLFSCLLWDAVREDAHRLMDQGNNASKAWRIAMMDALRDQSQYVSIPRRLADTIVEIWTLHFRLVSRSPNRIKQILGERRFRAAYDFMLLRSSLSEVDSDLADWWTEIQELDEDGKQGMIDGLLVKDVDEDGEDSGEPNFNSVEYQGKHEQSFTDGPAAPNRGRGGHRHKQGGRKPHAKNGRGRNNSNNSSNQGGQRRSNTPGGGRAAQGGRPASRSSDGANSGNSQAGNQGNNQANSQKKEGSNATGEAKKTGSRAARSNPYRSRRKKFQKPKKEDSYF